MRQEEQSNKTDEALDRPGPTPETAGDEKSEVQRFKDLPPAAQRALREANARREKQDDQAGQPAEVGGRGGKDPSRYGDWEIDGRAVDF